MVQHRFATCKLNSPNTLLRNQLFFPEHGGPLELITMTREHRRLYLELNSTDVPVLATTSAIHHHCLPKFLAKISEDGIGPACSVLTGRTLHRGPSSGSIQLDESNLRRDAALDFGFHRQVIVDSLHLFSHHSLVKMLFCPSTWIGSKNETLSPFLPRYRPYQYSTALLASLSPEQRQEAVQGMLPLVLRRTGLVIPSSGSKQ
ncbi:hypothetical protein IW261DRAFT_900644 [Armillaria novae-zelandiae]|uniref:Uncharacterized protein n=1 Tax=Armillaria novae-zelandiae TaxID=153914 RepID=A0AA39T8C1_9AGAR|nr:hypothetical protein IW261DRAFT_900644 [Armillaria novae-zelandiae]